MKNLMLLILCSILFCSSAIAQKNLSAKKKKTNVIMIYDITNSGGNISVSPGDTIYVMLPIDPNSPCRWDFVNYDKSLISVGIPHSGIVPETLQQVVTFKIVGLKSGHTDLQANYSRKSTLRVDNEPRNTFSLNADISNQGLTAR